MLNEFHYRYGNFLTSGMHVFLVLVGARIGTPGGWVFCLALVGAISLFAWSANFRRARVVSDTPTSRVASAPQGYVELHGKAKLHPGRTMTSPVSLRPCVWFRYVVEEKRGDKWHKLDSGMSSDTFLLDDGTGQAVIDPDCAEIMTTDRRTWREGSQRYTEWLFTPGEDLYVLGEFSTEGGAASELDTTGDVNALLGQWKADKPALLKRFDLDGDGQIDLKEWELARRAALRQVRQAHQEILSQAGVNMLRKPRDGQLFVLSDLSPQQMARRYGFWTLVQLIIAVGAGVGLLYVFTRYVLHA
jgi:hypothetical protein